MELITDGMSVIIPIGNKIPRGTLHDYSKSFENSYCSLRYVTYNSTKTSSSLDIIIEKSGNARCDMNTFCVVIGLIGKQAWPII